MKRIRSRSRDVGAEIRIHSFTVDCDTFSNEVKIEVVVLVTSEEVDVKGSKAMFATWISTL